MVLLDMGGTLVDPYPSVGHIYAKTARRFGMVIDADDTNRVFAAKFHAKAAEAALMSVGTEKRWWYELVDEVVGELCMPRSFDAFFEEVYHYFTLPRAWMIYPDVMPFLEELRERGIRAAIVSNWDSRLIGLCERLGITSWVEFVVVSAIVGSAKPDAGIFNHALERAGITAEQAIYVGDNVEMDVRGAMGVGMDAVLIDRGNRCRYEVPRRVTALTDILSMM